MRLFLRRRLGYRLPSLHLWIGPIRLDVVVDREPDPVLPLRRPQGVLMISSRKTRGRIAVGGGLTLFWIGGFLLFWLVEGGQPAYVAALAVTGVILAAFALMRAVFLVSDWVIRGGDE